MTESAYIYVIGPAVTAVIAGIGWLVKYILDKRDKKHTEEIEERNRRREEIEKSISEVKAEVKVIKRDLNKTQAIILACDKPDCPSKILLADYLNKKSEKED